MQLIELIQATSLKISEDGIEANGITAFILVGWVIILLIGLIAAMLRIANITIKFK